MLRECTEKLCIHCRRSYIFLRFPTFSRRTLSAENSRNTFEIAAVARRLSANIISFSGSLWINPLHSRAALAVCLGEMSGVHIKLCIMHRCASSEAECLCSLILRFPSASLGDCRSLAKTCERKGLTERVILTRLDRVRFVSETSVGTEAAPERTALRNRG